MAAVAALVGFSCSLGAIGVLFIGWPTVVVRVWAMWSARVYADEKYRTFLQMLGDSRVGRLNSWLLGMPVEQAIEEARRDPAAPAAMVWSVRLLGIAALIFPALILALAVFAAVR